MEVEPGPGDPHPGEGIEPREVRVAGDGEAHDPAPGLPPHVRRPTAHHQPSAVDDRDRIAELLDLVHLVRAEDDCPATRPQLQECVLEEGGIDRVQAGERLVHEQDVRVVQDPRDELDLLLVALAQLIGTAARVVRDPETCEPVPGPRRGVRPSEPVKRAEEDKLIEDLHPWIQPAVLGQVSPRALGRASGCLAVPRHGTLVGVEDVEDDAHGRGLPGPVRAEESEDLPGLDGEADPVERHDVVEAFAEPVDDERHATSGVRGQWAGDVIEGRGRRRSLIVDAAARARQGPICLPGHPIGPVGRAGVRQVRDSRGQAIRLA
jgi:hypothetical protein